MTTNAELADGTQRARIAGDRGGMDETLFVEAGAGTGKTTSLVRRVEALVADGVDLGSIVAITFTEKAAAELRDRIRGRLTERARDEERPEAERRRFRTALEELDAAAICTLHAFARRLLNEHPIEAGLPPKIEVLDEVASQIAFEERWRNVRDRLLADEELERTLLLAYSLDMDLKDVKQLVVEFDANWDLVSEPGRIPWDATEPSEVDADEELISRIDAILARRDECSDPDDSMIRWFDKWVIPFRDQLAAAPDEFAVAELLVADKPTLKCGHVGNKNNWRDKQSVVAEIKALRERRDELCAEITETVLHRLAVAARDIVLEAAEQRRAEGRLEFHDLLVLARELLRDDERGPAVRSTLRERYQRLLLDEFQDTDPIQIELAVLLAAPAPEAGGQPWDRVDTDPGRLFFVGDPKQSIYRFRRADIALFLQAREVFSGADPVRLTTNFRTTPPVIDWINHVFGELITHEKDSQPEYRELTAAPDREAPPTGPAVAVLGDEVLSADLLADDVRELEAAAVADTVTTAVSEPWQVTDPNDAGGAWRDCRLGDITILLPARTSLPQLERALDDRDIPYRAESSSLVYSTREVRDVMATMRVLADPTDHLSLLTALRSAVFGCGDDDLVTYRRRHRGSWDITEPPPADLPEDHPVGVAMRTLADLRDRVAWSTPSELLDQLCRRRRLYELGYAQGRPRDLWRRLRFVIDQARAWSEAEGGTLREYVEWAHLQASESTRVAQTVLPETDDDSVRIMTIHGAKGLEFPVTILSGMTTASRYVGRGVQVVWPSGGPVGIKASAAVKTREYEDFEPIDEQMDHHERLRLLYVACTRTRDHLVVSQFRKERASRPDQNYKYWNSELLADAGEGAPHQVVLDPDRHEVAGRRSGGADRPELTDWEQWNDERREALRTSGRPRSVGATGVQELLAEDLDEGDRKDPRDLELPAWQKGRYGSAVGRAVHAVLQTIDLTTGEGLDAAAAAQAAAEGVIDREGMIRTLAAAALEAPTVREATRHQRWRETYVATSIGDVTLEGYVDLLFRTGDGLVVVDYKTAGSTDEADLDARTDHYRPQAAAYAHAVAQATGEPVARVVLVYLTPDGAVEHTVTDLDPRVADLRAHLTPA